MPSQTPIVFLWQGSPWASKVQAYLALRNIPHTLCIQPITQPRPDLAALGVKYRRIPILAMGRDIYCDSLLIIDKIEEWYADSQHKPISAKDSTGRALEKLLEKWTDVCVFGHAAEAIPSDLDLVKDPAFQKDREDLWGRPWTKEEQDRLRPSALANLRTHVDFLEVLLGDGRQWVNGNEGPGLADIHAAWIFYWLSTLPNGLPKSFFNSDHYPNTIPWLERYGAAITKAKEEASQPKELPGPDTVARILASDFHEENLQVKEDPSGFKAGDVVHVAPVDTGYSRRDTGKLLGLTTQEVIIGTVAEQEAKEIRLHYPRWNYSIESAKADVTANGGH